MNQLRLYILPVLLCLSTVVMGQSLKQSGNSAKDIVPEGWEVIEAEGDLNKDGISDLAIIATPNFEEHLKHRDDGYVYNFNQPLLGIYWGNRNGGYTCWKIYDKVIPAQVDEYIFVDLSLSITDRGVLKIDVSTFASAGGWGQGGSTYLFRYQSGDFFLIGKDESSMMRNTGETTLDSYNYLTSKHQRITYNEFDPKVKRRETWKKLKKAPLQRLEEVDLQG